MLSHISSFDTRAVNPRICCPQDDAQRSIHRCQEAETEAASLRSRVSTLEESNTNRGAVVELETRVDELEEELRRAAASKVEIEASALEIANRAKRLQGEVDMMRSEYEIVSEQAADLRGSLVAAEVRRRVVYA